MLLILLKSSSTCLFPCNSKRFNHCATKRSSTQMIFRHQLVDLISFLLRYSVIERLLELNQLIGVNFFINENKLS